MRKRSRMLSIHIPDSNEVGLKFIKHTIKVCSNNKLYGILGKIEEYPDSEYKTKIKEMVDKQLEKRGLKHDIYYII